MRGTAQVAGIISRTESGHLSLSESPYRDTLSLLLTSVISSAKCVLDVCKCIRTGDDIVPVARHLTHYEILAVSPNASREEIDQACVNLWYRHQSMRSTPLWRDLNRHIEDIRTTLLDAEARTRYDQHLIAPNRKPISQARDVGATGNPHKPPAGEAIPDAGKETLPAGALSGIARAQYPLAFAPAMLFNRMVDWVRPEDWVEMMNIALLDSLLCLSLIGFVWSASRLIHHRGARTAATRTM